MWGFLFFKQSTYLHKEKIIVLKRKKNKMTVSDRKIAENEVYRNRK